MRGRFKSFLGYAAGTGKTYRMLEEGQKLKQQAVDVVIGYFEPHGRKDTIAKTESLEIMTLRAVEYRGVELKEMDTEAILRRNPKVCLVDELAHTNVPGSPRLKRWEDAFVILDAGIDVLSTMNLQHLESLNDQMFRITGVRICETVPDWVLKEADEVVMVDLTPEALLNRIKRGVVYDPNKADQALKNFFKESKLTALRELALRQAALEVDIPQEQTLSSERILVHITTDPATSHGHSTRPANGRLYGHGMPGRLHQPVPGLVGLVRGGTHSRRKTPGLRESPTIENNDPCRSEFRCRSSGFRTEAIGESDIHGAVRSSEIRNFSTESALRSA